MPHDAFVLAAGFGTRLQPLTHHRPKPLVPVAGVPMLAYALASCARHGLTDVVVNAHHLPDQIRRWRGPREGCDVTVSVEMPDILGTAGGLKAVEADLATTFAVVNADVLSDVDLRALVAAVPPGGAAMALRPHEADRYGVVAADATGTVVDLKQLATAPAQGPVARDTHFTGLHAMDRAALADVPEGFGCIVRTAYVDLVPQRRVTSVRHEGTWLDVGDPRAYLAANLAVLTSRCALPLDPVPRSAWAVTHRGTRGTPPTGVVVEGTAWVGPDAVLGDGVRLRDTVVGDRATIAPGASLTRCVVWDGADVPAGTWVDAVFHDGGFLHVTST